MAEAYWIVTRDLPEQPHIGLINGIHTVIINADDAGSSADTVTDAETILQADGYPIPDGYFTTAVLLTTLLPDDTDVAVIHPKAAYTTSLA